MNLSLILHKYLQYNYTYELVTDIAQVSTLQITAYNREERTNESKEFCTVQTVENMALNTAPTELVGSGQV